MIVREIRTKTKIGKILAKCKTVGLVHVEYLEIFIFVCENLNLTVREIAEKINGSEVDRAEYTGFLYTLNRLGQGNRRLRGIGLIDLTRRKEQYKAGQPAIDIRLTSSGRKLWNELKLIK